MKIPRGFGEYPSCDHLNNAIRFLLKGNTHEAIEEIEQAIYKANGYFHEDIEKLLTEHKETNDGEN